MSNERGYFAAGAGAPVVMLHSSLSSKSQWNALAERLTPRFRVIALDLCGYGDNPVVAGRESFGLDDELHRITDHLDRLVEPGLRLHVVGHSYGGLVALRFAQRSKWRIASLSLYEPVAFGMLGGEGAAFAEVQVIASRVAALVRAERRKEASQVFVDFWSGAGSYAALPPAAQDSIARRIDKVPLDFQAARRWPLDAVDLCSIAAPTLLLAGNRGPDVTQQIFSLLTVALRNCRARRVDSGHMGPITDPSRVNPFIETFLDSCTARSRASAEAPALSGQAPLASAVD